MINYRTRLASAAFDLLVDEVKGAAGAIDRAASADLSKGVKVLACGATQALIPIPAPVLGVAALDMALLPRRVKLKTREAAVAFHTPACSRIPARHTRARRAVLADLLSGVEPCAGRALCALLQLPVVLLIRWAARLTQLLLLVKDPSVSAAATIEFVRAEVHSTREAISGTGDAVILRLAVVSGCWA